MLSVGTKLRRELGLLEADRKAKRTQLDKLRKRQDEHIEKIEELGLASGKLEATKQDLLSLQRKLHDIRSEMQKLEFEIASEVGGDQTSESEVEVANDEE